MYRPPQSDASFWQKLEGSIQPINDLNIPVLLADDFNIDMMGNQCTPLKNLLTRLNLTNVVGEPTRITPSSATCIALLVTNRPNLILNVDISSNFCSDHCPVSADVNVKVNKQLCFKRIIKIYDKADYASMNDELNIIDWNTIFHNKTINDDYSNFLSTINRVCDKHIPSKVVVIRPDDKPFMNSSIRKAIRKRDRIHYKAKSKKNTGFGTGKHEMMSLVWLD